MPTGSDAPFRPTRVIAVVLDEAEWQAFVSLEPQPVAWVRQRIRERLEEACVETPGGVGHAARSAPL